MKNTQLLLVPIFLVSFFLFYKNLNYYFFQDDWFVLNWSRTGSFASFLTFRTDIIYWRPLTMPILFFTLYKIFNLNAFMFHITIMILFFVLIFLVYKLFLMLTRDKIKSLTASYMYAIWPIHYLSLSWTSTASYIIGPIFQSMSFIFFILFSQNQKTKNFVICLVTYLLALGSSELSLVLPIILFAWLYFAKKKIYIKVFLPFIFINVIYLFIRFFLYPIPATDQYSLQLNFKLVNNYIWYVLWAIGFPESFKELIFPSLPAQSLRNLIQFWKITLPVVLLAILLAYYLIKSFAKVKNHLIFGVLWLTIGLLPVLFLPSHSYPLYLSFAGIGFLYLVITLINTSSYKPLIVLAFLWSMISITNLEFTNHTHWAKNVQAVSKAYVDFTRSQVKDPPSRSLFIFKPANIDFAKKHNFVLVDGENTLQLALNNKDAMKVIYNDSSIESYYAKNGQNPNYENENIFEISPRLVDDKQN